MLDFVLFVARYAKPPFGFRWEIRQGRYGVSLERATRSFSTEEEARQAGEAAVRTLRGA